MGVASARGKLSTVQHTATDEGFHRCWYPVAVARDVSAEAPIGRDFLGTRVVAYRDAAGRPVVQSAWCPHLGADLSVGQIADGRLRCPHQSTKPTKAATGPGTLGLLHRTGSTSSTCGPCTVCP